LQSSAPVAQGIERLPSKQRVAGSNPAGRAIITNKNVAFNDFRRKRSAEISLGLPRGYRQRQH
jgi:hypothetical protein